MYFLNMLTSYSLFQEFDGCNVSVSNLLEQVSQSENELWSEFVSKCT